MGEHSHREYVEGCYRCDLSRDEVQPADRPDVEAIEALAEAATPGPWQQTADTPWGSKVIINSAGEMYVGVSAFTAMPTAGWHPDARRRAYELRANKCADAAFIAHARQDVPALTAYVRELEAKLRQACRAEEAERDRADAGWTEATALRAENERLREVAVAADEYCRWWERSQMTHRGPSTVKMQEALAALHPEEQSDE